MTKRRRLNFAYLAVAALLWTGISVAAVATGGARWPFAVLAIGVGGAAAIGVAGVVFARRAYRADRTHTGIESLRSGIHDLAARVDELGESQFRRSDRLHSELINLQMELARINSTLPELAGVSSAVTGISEATAKSAQEISELRNRQVPELRSYLRWAGITDYEQTIAERDLRRLLDVGLPMPPLRGWAASPDVLRILVMEILERRPNLVLECGSGASSVWLGLAMRRAGGGSVICLEHEADFAERSRRLIDQYGLSDIVEVRHAPLAEFAADDKGTARVWYDTRQIADLKEVGIVFIDGPPGNSAREARYPAIPALIERCTADALFVLDDAARPDERAIAERWSREYAELSSEFVSTEKGTAILTRSKSAGD